MAFAQPGTGRLAHAHQLPDRRVRRLHWLHFQIPTELFYFENAPFPLMTLAINIIGSFAIMLFSGLFVGVSDLDERWMLFLRVGLCGGFTTFSTFSMEALRFLEQGNMTMAAVYVSLSCVSCLAAAFLGEIASAAILSRPN